MDSETVRLIVTAGAAVVAGLGGALITSVVTRKNTRETLAAARVTNEEDWQRRQQQEHDAWLRNEKKREYIVAISATDAIVGYLVARSEQREFRREIPLSDDFMTVIMVLGTDDIKQELSSFGSAAQTCMTVLSAPDSDWISEDIRSALADVRNCNEAFQAAVRKDLGVRD